MPNEISKKSILTIIVIGVVVTLLWFFSGIVNVLNQNNSQELVIEDMKASIKEENVVKNQTIYIMLDTISSNYINHLINAVDREAYDIFTRKLKSEYSYSEFKKIMNSKIETYYSNLEGNELDSVLYKAYLVKDEDGIQVYILELNTSNASDKLLIGIQFNQKTNSYKIDYIEK